MASKCLDEYPIHDNINERWYYGDLSNIHPYEGHPHDVASMDWDLYIFVEAKRAIFIIFVIIFISVYGYTIHSTFYMWCLGGWQWCH